MEKKFNIKKHLVERKSIVITSTLLLSFFTIPSCAHGQEHAALDIHKLFYGFHIGFTESKVSLYYSQGGEANALVQGDDSFYAPGFCFSVIGGVRLGNYFSLRSMPGMALISQPRELTNITGVPSTTASYKVESVCAELPIDVKFHPFRIGKWQPYLCTGFRYSFNLNSLQKDCDNETIQRLNTHNLDYTCGLGTDWLTRYLKVGIELKVNFGITSPRTNNANLINPIYFHGDPSFSIGINIEA